MKVDFSTNVKKFIEEDIFQKYNSRKDEVFKKLDNDSMNGWMMPPVDYLDDIYRVRDRVKNNSKCLVVVGIGGSFLGAKAFYDLFTPYFKDSFKIIFAGTTLSSRYLSELIDYLKDVDFSLNVISKSGTTMETTITYSAIRKLMEEKYSIEELKERIIMTTDPVKGKLREEVNKVGYDSFVIPDNIGGRYSLLTAAHLLPLSFVLDIEELIKGYMEGLKLKEEAFLYAVTRRSLFDLGFVAENYVGYDEKWSSYLEWIKQLFGETEGKDGKGLLPVSMIHTRDLHSLGQFVQDGNKILFETFIKVDKTPSLIVNDKDLSEVNLLVEDAVIAAHVLGSVPCNILSVKEVNVEEVGKLSAFMCLAAAFSGFLFDINPFNQPGVEIYKQEVRNRLGQNNENK